MSQHVFLTARPQPIPRWLEAFPTAQIQCGYTTTDAVSLANAAIIWLHATAAKPAIVDWVSEVKKIAGSTPIVVLSNVPEDKQGLAALSSGASGYCSALTLPEVLHQVAGVVEQGGLWVGPQLMQRFMQALAPRKPPEADSTLNLLSQREQQVAIAVARGSSNKEIARVLGITERTVKAHLTASFEKLGVRDRIQLALVVNGVEESTPPTHKSPHDCTSVQYGNRKIVR